MFVTVLMRHQHKHQVEKTDLKDVIIMEGAEMVAVLFVCVFAYMVMVVMNEKRKLKLEKSIERAGHHLLPTVHPSGPSQHHAPPSSFSVVEIAEQFLVLDTCNWSHLVTRIHFSEI